jgi:hypothetical protein
MHCSVNLLCKKTRQHRLGDFVLFWIYLAPTRYNEAQLRELVDGVGGKIIFNAPKSPGDAPVEEAIGAVKSYLRFLEQPEYLKDPMWAITRALRSVTPGDAQGFFRSSPLFYPDADVAGVLPEAGADAIRAILLEQQDDG